MRKSWQVFMEICPAGVRVLYRSVVFMLPIHTLNYWIDLPGVLIFQLAVF